MVRDQLKCYITLIHYKTEEAPIIGASSVLHNCSYSLYVKPNCITPCFALLF